MMSSFESFEPSDAAVASVTKSVRKIELQAPATAVHFLGDVAAFVNGEETVVLADNEGESTQLGVHGGGILCATSDGKRLITGAGFGGAPHVKMVTFANEGFTTKASFLAYSSDFHGGVKVAGFPEPPKVIAGPTTTTAGCSGPSLPVLGCLGGASAPPSTAKPTTTTAKPATTTTTAKPTTTTSTTLGDGSSTTTTAPATTTTTAAAGGLGGLPIPLPIP